MKQLTGTMDTIGGRPVLRFERRLAHPPEKVWKAITDPAEMAHWFPAQVETELKVGAKIRFVMDEIDDTFGEIVEIDPPKLFVFHWDSDVLRWELIPDGAGCRLVFSHTLSGSATWGDAKFGAQHAAGWDGCLDLLAGRLDGVEVESGMDDWFERNERYVEEFGLAEGEVRDHPDGQLIRFERVLVRPIEKVWALLADATGSSGADVTVGETPPPRATIPPAPAGSVTSVTPERVVEYTWRHGGTDAGRVGWELTPQDFGCRLVLTQTVPPERADLLPQLLATWQVHVEELIARLHDVTRPWPTDRVTALQQMYEQRLR
jgi:uncharacterized protein YndB with AHSA1/START domain